MNARSLWAARVTEVARNFSAVLDAVERDQEEVVLVRNRRQIARLVPEALRQDALEVFGDLYRTLDDETAEALSADIQALTRQEPVYLSPVNVAEIRLGLELLRAGALRQKAASALRRLRRKPQLRITMETAEVFGVLVAKLRKAGRDPDVRIDDLWLAAQAVQRDFNLLTSNPKHYRDIADLKLVPLPSRVFSRR